MLYVGMGSDGGILEAFRCIIVSDSLDQVSEQLSRYSFVRYRGTGKPLLGPG
jgi:hypothetical protein